MCLYISCREVGAGRYLENCAGIIRVGGKFVFLACAKALCKYYIRRVPEKLAARRVYPAYTYIKR